MLGKREKDFKVSEEWVKEQIVAAPVPTFDTLVIKIKRD
jgi:hypothetical protein